VHGSSEPLADDRGLVLRKYDRRKLREPLLTLLSAHDLEYPVERPHAAAHDHEEHQRMHERLVPLKRALHEVLV